MSKRTWELLIFSHVLLVGLEFSDQIFLGSKLCIDSSEWILSPQCYRCLSVTTGTLGKNEKYIGVIALGGHQLCVA